MKSACFTGHRNISADTDKLTKKIYEVIEREILLNDLTDFYLGGAVGFDTRAAQVVLNLRNKYPNIKLHLILPCSNEEQTMKWAFEQIQEFQNILVNADTVEYTSNEYYNGCMKKRNARLVECAPECCICYWNKDRRRSGTAQTVYMAQKKKIRIINLFY